MDRLTDKKIIIFGAGLLGKHALIYFGSRHVHCFADNYKAGAFYCGKHVISFEELCGIYKQYDLVIALGQRLFIDVRNQLLLSGIKSFSFFHDLLSVSDFESDPKLRALKSTHTGQKCFIMGNGPSLKRTDLDVIHKNNIFSFGSNRIYKIFDHTPWRPDVYCAQDSGMIALDMETMLDIDINLKLIAYPRYTKYDEDFISSYNQNNALFFSRITRSFSIGMTPLDFSADPSRCVFSGYTVTYVMLQWAAYMGFSEIYLLGVDNHYTTNPIKLAANADSDHFCNDYTDEHLAKYIKTLDYEPDYLCDMMTKSYEAAEAYSREHGFRIYNATRGGKLEVFERVDFDSLF